MKPLSEQRDSDPDVRRLRAKAAAVFLVTVMLTIGLHFAVGSTIWATYDVAVVYLVSSLPLVIAVTRSVREASAIKGFALLTLGILCAVLIPNIYVAARCRHELMGMEELLDQSRLGEARTKAVEVLRLAPTTSWRNRPLKDLTRQLNRSVQDLERQVALPLVNPTSDERLALCRQLAMLGRTGEALSELTPLLQSDNSLLALDLAGTIHEANGEWQVAQSFHQRAKDGWQNRSASRDQTEGLLRATTRLAYCERKLGQYERAEQGYLEAVALSPTAENHFLIAQFYEDMQQSAKARAHARTAMALDPREYTQSGQKLLNKLMVGHFGCLNVFRAESETHRPGQSAANSSSF